MKFLVTGADGQLASEFIKSFNYSNHHVVALNRGQLDISNIDAVSKTFLHYRPDVVLNCAAYNLVDKAEEDFNAAFKTNAIGVKNLAVACKKHNALLVHYSTDYVFDGTKEKLYVEDDKLNPINKYGESKLLGERFLTEKIDNLLLFRVSWVFGEGKQNFLHKLSEWTKQSKVLKIVCDQISIPTYTEDVVKITMLAIEKGLKGIYHLTNSGYASRYETAKYFIEKCGVDNLILPVDSDYFRTPARRPYFSAMSNARLSNILEVTIPDWRDAIDRFIKRMND
ncbi:MAG: dTDP-4-dehydrorhamnose reductase [Nitrospirae bacterium]|jgi:dTDP-4-dehydrorhamnose reductase|nr:dTDP-4-dehydrorhamnose reductase [Nitrospirota bacterium]MDA8339974.1 dTDP-4-dehydrorhamnose reductase [Nitrospiraceae bacterium]